MNKSKAIAFCSIFSALSVVLLYFGSILTTLDLTMAALCSLIVFLVAIEIGGAYPYLVYLVVSVLSLLISPDKFGSFCFFVFAGYYPMIKMLFEKKLHRVLAYVFKFIVFNAAMALIVIVFKSLFISADTQLWFTIIMCVSANIAFILFDIALTRLRALYFFRLRDRLGINKLLR